MTRDTSGLLSSLDKPEVHPFFAIELMFDIGAIIVNGETVSSQPLYFWTGLGDLTIGEITYIGAGNMISISEVKETADIQAAGATITMSGIPTEILALALQAPYQGNLARIKFGMTDVNKEYLLTQAGDFLILENGKLIDIAVGDPDVLTTLFVGYMDQMNIDEGPDTCTISVSVESKLIDLERPRVKRYTSASHKAQWPADLAFDFIPDLQDRPLSWGRKN